jgi:hypothetical protein
MALIEQHHADMDAAGTSFNAAITRVRTVANPDAAPEGDAPEQAAPAGSSDHSLGPDSGLLDVPRPPLPSQATGPADGPSKPDDERMRPLVGALQKGLSAGGEGLNSDRYGSLDPNTLRQSLKRFLGSCADDAVVQGTEIDAEKLRLASTHWLRHFFANSAASDGVSGTALMEALGHSSLATTSVYLRQERKRLVSEMGKMRRRGG